MNKSLSSLEPEGIYSLPLVGSTLSQVRGFYEDIAPMPDDLLQVKVAKEVVRYGTVAIVSAVATIAVF